MLRRLFGLAALTAAPLIGLISYHHVGEYRRLTAVAHTQALDRAQTIAAEYDRLLTGAQYLLVSVARRTSIRTRDPDACRTALIDIIAELQSYSALAAFDLLGRPICATFALQPNETVANRFFFRRAIASGGFALGNAVRNRTTGRLQLPAALPFSGPDGQVAGVVMLLIDLEWIPRVIDGIDSIEAATGPTVVVADREGTVIMQTPPPRDPVGRPLTLVPPLPLPLHDVLGATKAGTIAGPGHDNVRRIWGYSPLGVTPKDLFVAAGIDEAAAAAAVRAALVRSMTVSAALLALALFAGTSGGWLLLRRRRSGLLSYTDKHPESGSTGYATVAQLTRLARDTAPMRIVRRADGNRREDAAG